MKILIYCEAKSERQYYKAVCEEMGVEAVAVDSTDRCLQQLNTHHFQLIIFSLHLIEVHSFDLASTVRQMPRYASTPIVVMTAEDRSDVLQDALKANISDVCEKRHIQNLKSIIERMNTRHKQIDAKVLYLEDDKAVAGATIATLKTVGFNVDWCSDLKTAQDFANLNEYDLVLLDTVLINNESGIDFLIWLRANAIEHNLDVPILVVSSFSGADRKIQIFNAGADDFLSKPYVEDELLARTISLIERKKLERIKPSVCDPILEQKRTRFLATIAHDLRAPLNAVLGNLQLLENSPLDAVQLNNIAQAMQSAGMMSDLIGDLLDFSLVKDDQFALYPKHTNLHLMCKEVFNTVDVVINKQDVELTLVIDPQLPVEVNIDALRLKQVLLNLLSNAKKFTKKGCIEFKIEFDAELKQAIFHVTDTGKGISQADLSSIFETFSQSDRDSKEAEDGFGLGLAICYRLVSMFAGTIQVDSTLNQGSHFYFNIPLMVVQKATGNTQEITPFEDNQYNVLVVDDNLFNLEVMKGLLNKLNVSCQCANNGLQGLKLLESQRFDVVILDIVMPIMDGYTMAEQMRYDSNYNQISIIASSGSFNEVEKQKCLSFGMNYFLPKPIHFPDAKKVLKLAFDRSSLCANKG